MPTQSKSNLLSTVNVVNDLMDFWNEPNVIKLRRFYDSPSFFEITGISRTETKHSYFLKWLLEGKDFNASSLEHPICSLLKIWANRAMSQNKQKKVQHFNDVQDALATGSLKVSNVKVKLEDITSKSSGEKPDLVIDFITEGITGGSRSCKIVLENKTGTSEHPCSTGLWQTEQYFKNYRKQKNVVFYVYLTPISPNQLDVYNNLCNDETCHDEHFVHICYQDILNEIVIPILSFGNISDKTRFRLKEYTDTLTLPTNEEQDAKRYVMAVSKDEADAVKAIWKKYNHVILSALRNKSKFWTSNEILLQAIIDIMYFVSPIGDCSINYRELFVAHSLSNKNINQCRYIIGNNYRLLNNQDAARELATIWADTKSTYNANDFNVKMNGARGRKTNRFSDKASQKHRLLICKNRTSPLYFDYTSNCTNLYIKNFIAVIISDIGKNALQIDYI